MDKELCFCIEKKNLYLEQVLVDYMGIPIFFLCTDRVDYFIVLCTDIDELNYIIAKLSFSQVYDLLHGKIPMRDVILNQRHCWEVTSGEEVSLDIVRRCQIHDIDISLLPEENAYFKILTADMKAFVREFDNAFFSAQYFNENVEVKFSQPVSLLTAQPGVDCVVLPAFNINMMLADK